MSLSKGKKKKKKKHQKTNPFRKLIKIILVSKKFIAMKWVFSLYASLPLLW